jgi:hypothetical protein
MIPATSAPASAYRVCRYNGARQPHGLSTIRLAVLSAIVLAIGLTIFAGMLLSLVLVPLYWLGRGMWEAARFAACLLAALWSAGFRGRMPAEAGCAAGQGREAQS